MRGVIRNMSDLDNEEIEATRNLKVNNGDKEIKELRKKVKELEQEVEKYKKSLIKRIKYCNELEKDLFENCENYVVNKKTIKNRLEKTQKSYKESLKQINLKELEKVDKKIFESIKLEVERELLRNLLQESENK